MTSSPNHPEDPGRDPEGLDPPRDILDAAGGVTEEGRFTPPNGDLDPLMPSDDPDSADPAEER